MRIKKKVLELGKLGKRKTGRTRKTRIKQLGEAERKRGKTIGGMKRMACHRNEWKKWVMEESQSNA